MPVVLFILNWPITEILTINKTTNTVTMRRKLFLKTTEYNTSLEGSKDITMETYKQRVRLAIMYGDGMHFPLSTHFFPSKMITESVMVELRDFLGFKHKPKISGKKSALTDKGDTSASTGASADADSGSDSSNSDVDLNDEYHEEDGQLNWDKAIDDWEDGVKDRRTFRS